MSSRKTVFLTLFAMLLWGSLFPVIKLCYGVYGIKTTGSILYFAGVRFTVCGIIITVYAFLRDRKSFSAVKSCAVPILLSGVFSIILHYGFTYTGLEFTDSSKTAILKQIGVLFYVCFSFLFFKDDKVSAKKIIAVIMGFLGIIAINADGRKISFSTGDILIVSASFCTVFSNVISKKVFKTAEPITATGISQLFGGAVLFVCGKILGGSLSIPFGGSMLLTAYILIASVLSYSVWFTVVKSSSLSKLFIIKFAEPLFACIFSALILGEDIFKIQYLASFLLIAGGIYISNK